MTYLDSSALVKLVVSEPESDALRRYLAVRMDRVSSALARVEVRRAVRRRDPSETTRRRADDVLARIALVAVDEPVLRTAASMQPDPLRSLDAVHLATALSLAGLDIVVTYDQRLADAAVQHGLEVAAPS